MIDAKNGDEVACVVYDSSPVILLFGDDDEGLQWAGRAAARAHFRVADRCSIEHAEARLDRQVMARVALVLADRPSVALERLIARLDLEGQSGRLRPIVVAPRGMIDAVTTAELTFSVEHLIEPTEEDLVVQLSAAMSLAPSHLADSTRSNGTGVLQQLSEEAARLASVLASLSSDEVGALPGTILDGRTSEGDQLDPAFVRSIIRARRMRDRYFRGELFADPAWDMLLDLFAARLEGSRVAVSSLCIAAAVPATTALRWIKALTDRGLLVRAADPQDGRRVYIELSPDAASAMSAYLEMVRRMSPAII